MLSMNCPQNLGHSIHSPPNFEITSFGNLAWVPIVVPVFEALLLFIDATSCSACSFSFVPRSLTSNCSFSSRSIDSCSFLFFSNHCFVARTRSSADLSRCLFRHPFSCVLFRRDLLCFNGKAQVVHIVYDCSESRLVPRNAFIVRFR